MNLCEKTENHKLCALGIIAFAGIAIGVAVTLLILPESKQIEKSLKAMKKKMDATVDAGKEAIEQFIEDSEERLKDIKEKTSEAADDVISKVKKQT